MKQISAITMILLILGIPIYSSSVFAQPATRVDTVLAEEEDNNGRFGRITKREPLQEYSSQLQTPLYGISEAYAYGRDEIREIVAGDDDTTYVLEAYLEGEDISLGNFRINDVALSGLCGGTSSCTGPSETPHPNTFTCTCYDTYAPSEPTVFTAELRNSRGIVDSAAMITIIPDTLSPRTTYAVEVNGTNVTFEYDIEERSCTGASCTNKCAGVKSIKFYVDGALDETLDILGEPHDCTLSNSTSLTLSEGQKIVYMVVEDNVGNSETTPQYEIVVDSVAPQIGQSFQLRRGHDELEHIATAGPYSVLQGATVFVPIVESNEITSCHGNLSELNTNPVYNYESMDGEPVTEGSSKYCSFGPLVLDAEDGQFSIEVTAEDESGNSATETSTKTVQVDNVGPQIVTIGSDRCVNDVCYMKRGGNNVSIILTESGAGLDNRLIFLDLRNLNDQYNADMQVYNCTTVSGSRWKCYGLVALGSDKLSGQRLFVSVLAGSMDDVGNEVTGTNSNSIVADVDAPVFQSITVKPVGEDRRILLPRDDVEIKANITEPHSGLIKDNVFADFNDFNEGVGEVNPSTCSLIETGVYECEWMYNSAANGLNPNTELELTIRAIDNAGNEKDSSDDDVYGEIYLTTTVDRDVDLWKERVKITRRAMPLNKNFLWMDEGQGTYERTEFELRPKGNQPRFVHAFTVDSGSCTVDINGSHPVGIVSQGYLNDQPDFTRTEKYLIIDLPGMGEFKPFLEEMDELVVNCSISIIQSMNQRSPVYQPNEKATLILEIPLREGVYSDPTISSITELEHSKKSIETLDSIIGVIDWIDKIFGSICRGMNAVRQTVAGITATVCTVANVIPPLRGACESLGNNGISNWLNKIWYGNGYPENDKIAGTQFSAKSWGFYCQMFICTECVGYVDAAMQRGGWFSGVYTYKGLTPNGEIDPASGWSWKGDESFRNRDENNPVGLGDIQNNIFTSLLCVPPCVVGVKTFLEKLKTIEIVHNECLNRHAVLAQDRHQCDVFRKSQYCQQLFGPAWEFLFGRWIQAIAHGIIEWGAAQVFKQLHGSCGHSGWTPWHLVCAVNVMVETTGLVLEFSRVGDVYKSVSQAFPSTEEQQEQVAEAVDENTDEPPRYGGGPQY